jgi:flagellar protein FlgJ
MPEASQATGIPAHFMIAQAALETGWGRAELRFSDGTPTYNLFGIKAGRGWRARWPRPPPPNT